MCGNQVGKSKPGGKRWEKRARKRKAGKKMGKKKGERLNKKGKRLPRRQEKDNGGRGKKQDEQFCKKSY